MTESPVDLNTLMQIIEGSGRRARDWERYSRPVDRDEWGNTEPLPPYTLAAQQCRAYYWGILRRVLQGGSVGVVLALVWWLAYIH